MENACNSDLKTQVMALSGLKFKNILGDTFFPTYAAVL